MCISMRHISLVAGVTQGKVYFGIECRVQGKVKQWLQKLQPQRASLLGNGDVASLAYP